MRQLIGSGADTARDNGHAELNTHEEDPAGIPVPGNRSRKFSDVDPPRIRSGKSDSPQRLTPALRLLPDVGAARIPVSTSPLAPQGNRLTFSQVARARQATVHKSIEVKDSQRELQQERSVILLCTHTLGLHSAPGKVIRSCIRSCRRNS